jgi:chromosomal replication initiator protein
MYLLSDTGLGKSHLSHAVGRHLASAQPNTRVHYVTSEQFANEMISALRNDRIEAFKTKFRKDCDVLLLEKVEFFSGKEKIQSELVYTLDELMDRGKKILCTGSAFPKDIPRLSTELKSRLGGLLVAPIEPPDYATRVEIIKQKSRAENIQLPMDVVEFLADQVTSDVRRIESCLIGLMAKTSIMGVPITLGLAQEVSQTMMDCLPKITIEHIQDVVCSSFQITRESLVSSSRRAETSLARKIAMYLCRQYTKESLVSIGKSFKRSHSSVLYAFESLKKGMEEKGGKVKRQVEYLSRRLETSCVLE